MHRLFMLVPTLVFSTCSDRGVCPALQDFVGTYAVRAHNPVGQCNAAPDVRYDIVLDYNNGLFTNALGLQAYNCSISFMIARRDGGTETYDIEVYEGADYAAGRVAAWSYRNGEPCLTIHDVEFSRVQ